jgi:hypothetical protein
MGADAYRKLKDFATALNRSLKAGRTLYSPDEMCRRGAFAAEAGI